MRQPSPSCWKRSATAHELRTSGAFRRIVISDHKKHRETGSAYSGMHLELGRLHDNELCLKIPYGDVGSNS